MNLTLIIPIIHPLFRERFRKSKLEQQLLSEKEKREQKGRGRERERENEKDKERIK